jgi:hypothetical protein
MAGNTIKVAITSDTRGLTQGLKSSESQLASFGKKAAKAGAFAALAIGVGMVKFGAASVRAASDAQQSIGATETVFGKFASSVIKNSQAAADSVGLSGNAYRESANQIGALLSNQGVASDKLAGKTDKLVKMGADLAATFGGTTKDAVDALASSFKGEFDPLEKYGISIKQSTINTEAFRVAGVKTTAGFNKLTTAQQTAAKQQATTNLLMKQGAKSQGAFANESGTLAHQQQVLAAKIENLKAKIGAALLPMLTRLASYASNVLVPKLDKFADWLVVHRADIERFGMQLKDTLLPQLQRLGQMAVGVASFLSKLPDPLKSIGIQAALAAVALNKLSLSMTGSSYAEYIANSGKAKTATKALGTEVATTGSKFSGIASLARGAAGIGGVALLGNAVGETSKKMGVLKGAAGGALAGFAVGGPIGAGVGALAGGLLGLATNTKKAGEAAQISIPSWTEYKSTLDSVTGATTAATKEMAYQRLQQAGILPTLAQYGISAREAVNAIVQGGPARTQFISDLTSQKTALQQSTAASKAYLDSLDAGTTDPARYKAATDSYKATKQANDEKIRGINLALGEVGATTKAVAAMQAQIAATRNYSGLLKGLPPAVKTDIRANGIVPTIASVKALAVRYGLTPKQVKTVVKAAGVKASTKDIASINAAVKTASKAKIDGKPLKDSAAKAGRDAKGAATKGGKDVGKALGDGVSKGAKVNSHPLQNQTRAAANSAKGTAHSGGKGVGQALSNGTTTGINSKAGEVAAAAASMVSRAIAAARARARAQSPSRETDLLGRDLAAGLSRGMTRSQRAVAMAGRRMVNAALQGMTGGLDSINAAIERTNALIRKRITGKKQVKRENAIIKRYAKTYAALRKNGKAQDANNVKIDTAVEKVKDLKNQQADYSAAIKDSVVAYGSITALGADTGFGSVEQLISNLQGRVNQAADFATVIKDLQAQGLNQTNIQQLLDAGVEGGLGTAKTIASGGKAAIDQINALTKQLGTTGSDLGTKMGKEFYDAGIKSAQGIVDGLKKKQKDLDAAALRLGQKLAKAVRKALGIRSPSKVMAEIGDQTSRGLALGLDDVYVSKAGAQLATSLQQGFGQPDLTAAASTGPYGSAGMTLTANVTLKADQLSQLERGRSIQLDLDAYRAVGGRSRS